MNSYNTRYRQKLAGRRATRHTQSAATGADVTRKWEARAGDENRPIAGVGESLKHLEALLHRNLARV